LVHNRTKVFAKTNNPYHFQYLITGIKGAGIKEVYLPEEPADSEVLTLSEDHKFVRPTPPDYLQAWMNEFEQERNINPNYIHPHQEEINKWEDQEWTRSENGIWFWLKGGKTYLTGYHYKYLCHWNPLFGPPDYWEADREIFYWIQYWEEDPKSYGGALNSGRRMGKSAKMGFWIMNRTCTNFRHISGMQGETNDKIKSFYEEHVIEPFYKFSYFFKPTYDISTLQKRGIIFRDAPRRNKKRIQSTSKLVLESMLDYRSSESGKYDQRKLHSYGMEEPGKTEDYSVHERWSRVKPCLTLGINIIGKAFLGTTVEFFNSSTSGGKAYKKLVYESDFDDKGEDGETTSGLYAALMPADCAMEGCIDEWGFPIRERATKEIMIKRSKVKDKPKDYSELVRKYPLNWNEVFYISSENCEFNATILQDQKSDLLINPPIRRRVDLKWENNRRFTNVVMIDNPDNGWLDCIWLPKTAEEKAWLNNVGRRQEGGRQLFFPKNDEIFESAIDPIDHGVVIENIMEKDEYVSSRRSRPVQLVRRKYDPAIDGQLTQEILEQRARDKYPYKTNKLIWMMDTRPTDPNILFERSLMICWLLSVKLQVEAQKPGIINWFRDAGCIDFIWKKYVPDPEKVKRSDDVEGTPASPLIINEYTSALSTEVDYFGHTIPFIEVVEDLLIFNPLKTKPHDYAVAYGNLVLIPRMRQGYKPPEAKDVSHYFRTFRMVNGKLVPVQGQRVL